MTRDEFRAFRSTCRKLRISCEIRHNGRLYSICGGGCDRLDDSGCYDRPRGAMIAMTLAAAHHCRVTLRLPRGCRGHIGFARDARLAP